MPSFDIVSEITMHEVRNAVENTNRVLSTRYDDRIRFPIRAIN